MPQNPLPAEGDLAHDFILTELSDPLTGAGGFGGLTATRMGVDCTHEREDDGPNGQGVRLQGLHLQPRYEQGAQGDQASYPQARASAVEEGDLR